MYLNTNQEHGMDRTISAMPVPARNTDPSIYLQWGEQELSDHNGYDVINKDSHYATKDI